MRISDWSSDVCSSDLSPKSQWFQRIGRDRLGAAGDFAQRHRDSGRPGAGRRLSALREQSGHYRSEEHTSELQSLMRISYAVFCLKKKKSNTTYTYIYLDNIYNI